MTLSCWPKSSSGHCWSTATSRYVVLPNWSDFSPLLWSGNKLKPLSKQGFTLGCTTCPRWFWFLNASGLQLEYTSKLKIQLCRMPALAKQIFAALYKLRLSLLQDEEWDLLCVDIISMSKLSINWKTMAFVIIFCCWQLQLALILEANPWTGKGV